MPLASDELRVPSRSLSMRSQRWSGIVAAQASLAPQSRIKFDRTESSPRAWCNLAARSLEAPVISRTSSRCLSSLSPSRTMSREWRAELASANESLIVLLDHDAGGEPDQRGRWEDTDDVSAPTDLAVDALVAGCSSGALAKMIKDGDAEEIAGRDLASRGRATVCPPLSALGSEGNAPCANSGKRSRSSSDRLRLRCWTSNYRRDARRVPVTAGEAAGGMPPFKIQ
jgi:hypothetical protein